MKKTIKALGSYNLFIVVILFGVVSLISGYSKYQDLAQRNRSLRSKIEELTLENKDLMDRQHRLQTDPVFAESVARERLKVAQEGEVIYKILPEE